jgi:adenine/guanine phosphoribosyltransferase-like PRPP-binding protein
MTDSERDALRDELISTGFKRNQHFTYSDGSEGNNKLELDFDTLSQHPELFGNVVSGICEAMEPFDPDFVIGIPNGATEIAAAVSEKLEIPQVRLAKNPDKSFFLASYTDRYILKNAKSHGVLIDDVYRTGSNFQRAVDLLKSEHMDGKIAGAVAIFDRGADHKRKHIELPFKVNSVVAMYINEKIAKHSMLGRNPDKL